MQTTKIKEKAYYYAIGTTGGSRKEFMQLSNKAKGCLS
jgi:hypothetical protein